LNVETFRNDFMASLMHKLRYLAEQIVSLTTRDVEERLLEFLNEHVGAGPSVEVPLSRKDIAAAIGTTPETLSRVIHRLNRQGRFSWTGRTLRRRGTGAPLEHK
jgi:CRP/FNR family transcriptional regulator